MAPIIVYYPAPAATTVSYAYVRGILTDNQQFAVSEAVNSDRIGAFRWYTKSYNWDTNDTYTQSATSSQLRFGPEAAWTYKGVTFPSIFDNDKDRTEDWEEKFALTDLTMRVTVDGTVTDFPAIVKSDYDFNNQGGYIIIPSSSVGGWDWTGAAASGGMDVSLEILQLPIPPATTQLIDVTFTTDSTSYGGAGAPTSTPTITGLDSVAAQGLDGGSRINLVFSSSATRDAFLGDYPNGTAIEVELDDGTVIIISAVQWGSFGTTAQILSSQFDNESDWPADLDIGDSLAFTLVF